MSAESEIVAALTDKYRRLKENVKNTVDERVQVEVARFKTQWIREWRADEEPGFYAVYPRH